LEESNDELRQIEALSSRLPADSAVRRIASEYLEGRQPRVQPLIAALTNSTRQGRREREVAVRLLGAADLSEQDRYVAASVLSGVVSVNPREGLVPRWVRAVGWAALVTVLLIPLMMAVEQYMRSTGFTPGPMPANLDPQESVRILEERNRRFISEAIRIQQQSVMAQLSLWIPGVLLAMAGSLWSDVKGYGRANRIRVAAAEALGRLHAPEAAGALLASLFDRDQRVADAAAKALRDVLPTLSEEHAEQLDPSGREHLRRAVRHTDAEVALAAVEALSRVGRGDDIPAVEQAAAKGASEGIRSAAQVTLTVLRERKRREELSATLLRPDSRPHADVSTLLRPSTDAGEANPSQLLRASSSNNP
jgi:hypothetical protein